MKYPLSHIIFETAKACNLSCLYCYNHWRPENACDDTSDRLRWKTLKKIIKKIDFQRITFTGGEPFLTKDVEEHVLYSRMKKKFVNIISNGNVGSNEQYQTMSDLGVSLIQFPLLSHTNEIHDRLTGRNGSFQKVVNSIKFFKSQNTDICTVFVLTKMNIEQFEKTLEFAKNIGVKRVLLARFNVGGNGIKNMHKLIISKDELNETFSLAEKLANQLNIKITANVCVPHCVVNPDDYKNLFISSCSANFKKRPITIDAFGDIRLCNHSPKIVGNIHKDKLEDIFNIDYVKSWEGCKPAYCTNCDLWNKCRGGCRAASEQVNGSIETVDPIVKELLITK